MSKRSILFSLLFSLSLSVAARQDEFTYIGFSGGANGDGSNISLNEVAEVDDSGILRLTNKTSRLIGHAFYPVALRFRNATSSAAFSFSTVFAFAIAPEYPKLGGHGLAFTIAPTKELPGALPSQYLGLVNASDVGNATNHVFAVEFDTVQDFEFGDINDNQVGVDIYGLVSNSNASAAYYGGDGAKKDLNLKDRFTIQAWIDYDGGEKVPNVTISPFSSKPSTPRLSFRVDLFPVLLDDMFVGFSASNGLLASSHNLLGWSFKMKCVSRFLDLSSLPSLPLPKKKNITLVIAASITAFVLLITAISAAAFIFKASTSSDVFAFGALVLEVVCGRRPIEPKASSEELVLLDRVRERWRAGRWADVVDPRLDGEYEREEAAVAIKLGLWCSHPSAAARPGMREVVRYLDGGDVAELPPFPRPPESNGGLDGFAPSYPSSAEVSTGSTYLGEEAVGSAHSSLSLQSHDPMPKQGLDLCGPP
ncbi:Legume lectin domain [Musa troglodytarum]|uniref:non-specific serine/threonine protein kinase n=1 Tax=Musa troglodytarum TaxID=320322 RepID=A0A9E7KXJ7_9LILI|nr:Legume lectin domain [Musa troglodytarum]